MSNTTFSSNPSGHLQSNRKQEKAWRKKARRMDRNEDVRRKYPAFRASSKVEIIHVHYQTTIDAINELIVKASSTKRFVVDTESDKRRRTNNGGLIQIQFIHSIDQSTIILIETEYLPTTQSILFERIKELCSIIFNNNKEIISWGSIDLEFQNFHHLGLIHLGKMKPFNLQSLFSDWKQHPTAHPEMERRDHITSRTSVHVYDTPGEIKYMIDEDDEEYPDDIFDYDSDHPPANTQPPASLQSAVGETLGKFIDKTFTVNYWQCGIDLNLNTWRESLFSRQQYSERMEKQERGKMKQYAINDCASVAELFFHMYPDMANDYLEPHPPTTPPTSSTNTLGNASSIVSRGELPETFFPRFYRTTTRSSLEINQARIPILSPPDDEQLELVIHPTPEEIEQIISPEEERRRKAERQRRKNEKYKWKKKNLPHFDHKIRRPIYFKYDYRKIRSQLADDGIYTSHQLTINKEYGEVKIGFKSDEDLQRATSIIRINYFSKDQFNQRWGEIKTNDDKAN